MEKRLGYMFSGQGAQFPGMGRDLYEASECARRVFDEADEVLGYGLSKICFEGSVEDLTRCSVCQPAIYTMSQACLAVFQERFPGVEPVVCGGLSLGELSALCAGKVYGFADGLRLVARRGELMDAACSETSGGMAAVLGGDMDVIASACLDAGIDIANLNCPGQVVISGESGALERAVKVLSEKEIRVVPLTVAGAYHSRLMGGASEAFGRHLQGVAMAKPSCGIVQNVVGGMVEDVESLRDNLRLQVSSSVRWEDCVRAMMPCCDQLIEFGPGNVLCGFMKRIDRSYPAGVVNSMATLDALCAKLEG